MSTAFTSAPAASSAAPMAQPSRSAAPMSGVRPVYTEQSEKTRRRDQLSLTLSFALALALLASSSRTTASLFLYTLESSAEDPVYAK